MRGGVKPLLSEGPYDRREAYELTINLSKDIAHRITLQNLSVMRTGVGRVLNDRHTVDNNRRRLPEGY